MYKELEFPEEELEAKFLPKSKEQRETRLLDSKRYVITCDPYDEDTIRELARGRNVFLVFDKLNQSYSTRITTTRTFEQFVEDLIKKESRSPYVVSYKFIINGRPCNLGQANPGSVPSQRYNDTF